MAARHGAYVGGFQAHNWQAHGQRSINAATKRTRIQGGAPPWFEDVRRYVAIELASYDVWLLERFRLGVLPGDSGTAITGCTDHPQRLFPRSRDYASGYKIRASVRVDLDWPHVLEGETFGTRAAPTPPDEFLDGLGELDPKAHLPKHLREWEYVTGSVTLADAAEALVYVAGHEAYHFLRHSKQVIGRNTEPTANRAGLLWLWHWRVYNEHGGTGPFFKLPTIPKVKRDTRPARRRARRRTPGTTIPKVKP